MINVQCVRVMFGHKSIINQTKTEQLRSYPQAIIINARLIKPLLFAKGPF